MSDTPERHLSRVQVRIADVPNSEPARQLRALISDAGAGDDSSRKRTGGYTAHLRKRECQVHSTLAIGANGAAVDLNREEVN